MCEKIYFPCVVLRNPEPSSGACLCVEIRPTWCVCIKPQPGGGKDSTGILRGCWSGRRPPKVSVTYWRSSLTRLYYRFSVLIVSYRTYINLCYLVLPAKSTIMHIQKYFCKVFVYFWKFSVRSENWVVRICCCEKVFFRESCARGACGARKLRNVCIK